MALATATACGAYVTEWAIYALYFREVFGWQDAVWAGVAQMAGDLLGVFLLTAAPKLKCAKSCASISSDSCKARRCFAAPYHISVLLFSWMALHLMMASPNFLVAVLAQVLMGTVYAFQYQFAIEMLAIYGGSDSRIFKNIQFVSILCYNLASGGASVVTLRIYTKIGKVAPFQVAAGVASFACLVYTGYFIGRVGLPRSFKEFEDRRAEDIKIQEDLAKSTHADHAKKRVAPLPLPTEGSRGG